MTIQELRAKAAASIQKAAVVRDDNRPWSEKQAEFDALVKEATDAQKEIQSIEAHEQQMKDFNALHDYFTKPIVGIKALPVEDARTGMETHRAQIHREAFSAYLRGGKNALDNYAATQQFVKPAEIHALLSNDDTTGGFLVPDDWRNEVIKAEAGYTVLAPLCRVENTNRDALVFPKLKTHGTDARRTSGFTGQFQEQGYVTGGTAPTVQNYPKFEQERIPIHSWQPDAVEVSPELMEDSGANLEGIIQEAIAETLGFDKDDKILDGGGAASNEPEGVLQAGITTVASGGATSITIGGILGMYSEVPAQYRRNATWIMASRTMGAILQLNTGTGGVYLFPPNQWNDTILGRPVRFLDYGMDTATAAGGTTFTAGEYPIIFGDFKRYIIAQRAALRVQRLVERFAPNTGFLPTARFGGQVVLTDAFRIMTVSA